MDTSSAAHLLCKELRATRYLLLPVLILAAGLLGIVNYEFVFDKGQESFIRTRSLINK